MPALANPPTPNLTIVGKSTKTLPYLAGSVGQPPVLATIHPGVMIVTWLE